MHVAKKGLRALGIAESFAERESSTLAGVVMRKDMQIDGVALTRIAVGGTDATEGIERIVEKLHRRDVNILMLSGGIIAWYNIIDPERIHADTGLPVINDQPTRNRRDWRRISPATSPATRDDSMRIAAWGSGILSRSPRDSRFICAAGDT